MITISGFNDNDCIFRYEVGMTTFFLFNITTISGFNDNDCVFRLGVGMSTFYDYVNMTTISDWM